jgi:hypothetical protein
LLLQPAATPLSPNNISILNNSILNNMILVTWHHHPHLLQPVDLAEAIQARQQQRVQVPAVEQVGVLVQRMCKQLVHVCHHILTSHGAEVKPLTAAAAAAATAATQQIEQRKLMMHVLCFVHLMTVKHTSRGIFRNAHVGIRIS